jgi:hypothetical protein
MRKAHLPLIFLSLAIWSWGQAPPSAPLAEGQAPTENQQGGRHRPGVAGTITAINADSITVKTRDGQTAQVNLSDKTQFSKDRQPAKLADFKVGDEIFVRGQAAGQNTWQADMVGSRPAGGFGGGGAFRDELGKRFIAGEIKSINGTQLVIARPDGVSQTITVDESTSFQKQGESITLADLKPGDHVFGRGEMKNDVFVPAVLNLGDPRMMMMGRGRDGEDRGPVQGQGTGQGPAAPDSH